MRLRSWDDSTLQNASQSTPNTWQSCDLYATQFNYVSWASTLVGGGGGGGANIAKLSTSSIIHSMLMRGCGHSHNMSDPSPYLILGIVASEVRQNTSTAFYYARVIGCQEEDEVTQEVIKLVL